MRSRSIMAAAVVVVVLALAPSVLAQPYGAPATTSIGYQTVRHVYWYNATAGVYYDPDTGLYSWYQDGQWVSDTNPPAGVSLDANDWVFFESDATVPYAINNEIVPYYDSGGYFPLYGPGIACFDVGLTPFISPFIGINSFPFFDRDFHNHFHHDFDHGHGFHGHDFDHRGFHGHDFTRGRGFSHGFDHSNQFGRGFNGNHRFNGGHQTSFGGRFGSHWTPQMGTRTGFRDGASMTGRHSSAMFSPSGRSFRSANLNPAMRGFGGGRTSFRSSLSFQGFRGSGSAFSPSMRGYGGGGRSMAPAYRGYSGGGGGRNAGMAFGGFGGGGMGGRGGGFAGGGFGGGGHGGGGGHR